MYCPKCGKQIPDGSTSCPSCGATFQQNPTQAGPGSYQQYQQGPAQGQPQQTQSTRNGGESKKLHWWFAGLMLLALFLANFVGGAVGNMSALLCCVVATILEIVNMVKIKRQ